MKQAPDRLYDLPPSAKLVFKVLETNGQLTQGEIADESRLTKRTVRHAIERLRDADAVRQRSYFRDARKSLYSVPESVGADGSTGDTRATPSE